ncbi:SDR family NAD(P)-dependent oxidoreductase [Bosea caraganae]|uniref:SDR family NAD(P)-dependent oxidoreductase n=1 Tax=Bosea caraganae TaxID=2763117 RepID=A0A370L6G1_9HYPH|nr:glucose 1-dehydrogenase [Bosea caraganae]RDJ23149.1 SDR family NAD(P)-dependent oxidoreductase [Bosea caraganae]RDJ24738.1 SDR family NAD(P)-dependent oxidoreductase [Bosea caraganae]
MATTMFDLSGRVAIVTGGNGGIGLGLARGLAKAGASIVVAGRNAAKNTQAAAELRGFGVEVLEFALDVRKPESCRALVEATVAQFGKVDILVNNAGMSYRRAPQDYTLDEWNEVFETNVTGAFVLSQACYPHFLAAGGGKIINTGSIVSVMGSPFSIGYVVSKGGILQMTKALACAWAKDNIQSNAILPGWIETDMTTGARRDIPGLNDRVLARTPAGRWGSPQDFEGIAVFLAGPASNFLNGAAIPVDGGYLSLA